MDVHNVAIILCNLEMLQKCCKILTTIVCSAGETSICSKGRQEYLLPYIFYDLQKVIYGSGLCKPEGEIRLQDK